MMKMKICLLVLSIVCVGGFAHAAAMTAKEMTLLTNNVQGLCLTPSESGKYWQRESAAQGRLSSPLLFKILLKGELKGHVKLTESEKKGVQSVLKKHQASEHSDYRDCVREMLPIFIKNFSSQENYHIYDLYNQFSGIAQQKKITSLIDNKKYKEAIQLLENNYAERKRMLIEANTTVNILLSSLVALREMKGGYFSRPLAASMSKEEVKRVEKELVYDLSVAISNRSRNKALAVNAIIDVALVDALSQKKAQTHQYKKFQIALADAPDPLLVYYYYAQVLRDNGDVERANEMLSKAIQQIAKKDSVHENIYDDLNSGNAENQAKSKFEFIYEYVRHQQMPAHFGSGKHGLKLQVAEQLKHGQVKSAARNLKQLLKNNEPSLLQAQVDIMNGRMKAAKMKLDSIYAIAKNNVALLGRLSSLYLDAGQYDQVKKCIFKPGF